MSLSDLFKLNLKECKPLVKKTPNVSNKAKPIPIQQLFSTKHSVPVAVNKEEQSKNLSSVPSLLSFKREVQPTENANVSKGESDLDQVKQLNAKYIQVINEINEELTKLKSEAARTTAENASLKSDAVKTTAENASLKSDAVKTTAENAELKKENNDLSNKVSELSNAILNVVQQNKTLSHALGLRI